MIKQLVANLYNPHEQSKEQLIESFVVRYNLFKELFQEIKTAAMKYPEQHYLIEGQRGSGKTTLLLRLSYEIENDQELSKRLIPIVFKEEAYYGITRLFNLWEAIARELEIKNTVFTGLYERMTSVYNKDSDYERICFNMLIEALEGKDITGKPTLPEKKLILFIDNIGEMFINFSDQECHRLREILMTCPFLRFIGATSVVLEASFKYEHAFYEFFKKKHLEGLSKEETRALLLQLAKIHHQEDAIYRIIKQQPGRVETFRILTGGVIRTIVLLFEIFIDNKNGNAITDLELVLDRVTPLYKHRMDDLKPLQREVVDAIALNWDAISAEEIAGKIRRTMEDITIILGELTRVFIVQRVATDVQSSLYYLQERFFNIWYLMRLAPKGSQSKVIWLVRFLECWYSPQELHQRAKKLIMSVSKGDYQPKAAYYLTEALARTGKLDINLEHRMKLATRKLLHEKDTELLTSLSPSDKELLEEADRYYESNEYKKAVDLFLKIKNKNHSIYHQLGFSFDELGDFTKAEKYYLMAVEHGDVDAMYNLGVLYYNEFKDYNRAEKYYLMAVEYGSVDAMNNLGLLYENEFEDYNRAEKYYLMAVEYGSVDAMNNLGGLYVQGFKDYYKAEKYFLMAMEHETVEAMYNLGLLYDNKFKDYSRAEKYYLMAVEHGDVNAMINLGWLYYKEFKDNSKAEKYFLMAMEQGNVDAIVILGALYAKEFKDYIKAEKYYLMAVEHGDVNAMNNLGGLYVQGFKDNYKAEKYYLMAVEHGNVDANYLGWLYDYEFKDYTKAEKYYLMAVKHGNVEAMDSLGILYSDEMVDYKKAEEYFLMAVNKGHISATYSLGHLYTNMLNDNIKGKQCMDLAYEKAIQSDMKAPEKIEDLKLNELAWMLCDRKINKGDALKFILKAIELVGENSYNRYILAWIYLWHNEIKKALELTDKILADPEMIGDLGKKYSNLIMMLLAKNQYQYLGVYFNDPNLNLQERFKPLYYTLLYLNRDPNYHKMPPELSEPVADIIKQVNQMAEDYK